MTMLTRFFLERRDKKRKDEHERRLKSALAQKFSDYDSDRSDITASTLGDYADLTDYTEITFQGTKIRVRTEHITIQGLRNDSPQADD